MSEIRVISSLDSHLAIAEAFRRGFENAHKIHMVYPWYGTCVVHLMKRTVPAGAELNILVRTPEPFDNTYRAMEALEAESREMQWRFNAVCVPNLHGKFSIINDEDVLFGSVNPTNSGIYFNTEVLGGFYDMPDVAERFLKISKTIRRQEGNVRWELFTDYHGFSVDRKLIEITVRCLGKKPHKEARIPLLISEYERQGYSFTRAKEGFQEMEKYGFIYTTTDGFVKLNPKYEI